MIQSLEEAVGLHIQIYSTIDIIDEDGFIQALFLLAVLDYLPSETDEDEVNIHFDENDSQIEQRMVAGGD